MLLLICSHLHINMTRTRKLVVFFGLVLIVVAAVVVPVASSPESMPWVDNLQGYAPWWAIPKSQHLDFQHYWSALMTLGCVWAMALLYFE